MTEPHPPVPQLMVSVLFSLALLPLVVADGEAPSTGSDTYMSAIGGLFKHFVSAYLVPEVKANVSGAGGHFPLISIIFGSWLLFQITSTVFHRHFKALVPLVSGQKALNVTECLYALTISSWSATILYTTPRDQIEIIEEPNRLFTLPCSFSIGYYLHIFIYKYRYMANETCFGDLLFQIFRLWMLFLAINGVGSYYYIVYFSLEIIRPIIILSEYWTVSSFYLPLLYFYLKLYVGMLWYANVIYRIEVHLVGDFYSSSKVVATFEGDARKQLCYWLELSSIAFLIGLWVNDMQILKRIILSSKDRLGRALTQIYCMVMVLATIHLFKSEIFMIGKKPTAYTSRLIYDIHPYNE